MAKLVEIVSQQRITEIVKDNINFLYKADETLSSWLTKRIIIALKPYNNLDLVYSVESARDLFEAKLYENLPELLTRLRVDKQKFNAIFLNDDGTSGTTTTTHAANYGYSGFDTGNQSGNFERNNSTSTIKGNQTLDYMLYLDQAFKKWMNDFKNELINCVVKLIY